MPKKPHTLLYCGLIRKYNAVSGRLNQKTIIFQAVPDKDLLSPDMWRYYGQLPVKSKSWLNSKEGHAWILAVIRVMESGEFNFTRVEVW